MRCWARGFRVLLALVFFVAVCGIAGGLTAAPVILALELAQQKTDETLWFLAGAVIVGVAMLGYHLDTLVEFLRKLK